MEGCRRAEVLNVQLLTIKNSFDQVFRIIRAYWRVFVVRPLAELGVAGITDPSHNPEKYKYHNRGTVFPEIPLSWQRSPRTSLLAGRKQIGRSRHR